MAQPTRFPKSEQVIVMMTPADRDELDGIAAEERVTRSELVRDVLRAFARERRAARAADAAR